MKRLIIFLTAVLGLTSCSGLLDKELYINLSASSYTFNGIGDEGFVVNVECSGEWVAESEESWIKIIYIDKGAVKISVEDNYDKTVRQGIVNFIYPEIEQSVQFFVSQMSVSFKGRMENLIDLFGTQISDNGKWIFGTTQEQVSDGNWRYDIYRINTKTGEREKWASTYKYNEVKAVSDDGNKIVICNSMAVKYSVMENGEEVPMNVPDNYGYFGIEDMTPDGETMVGYVFDFNNGKHSAVKWSNNGMEFLERPKFNSWGGKLYNGLMARGISNDGRVIYGSEWDEFGLIYWVNGKMNYLGRQFADTTGCLIEDVATLRQYSSNSNISSNGKYIASCFDNTVCGGMGYPALINTETGNVSIYEDLYGWGRSVTNDGIVFCEYGTVVKDGKMTDISDYFIDEFGIELSGPRTITNISPDKNVYYGLYPIFATFGVIYKGWYLVLDTSLL